MSIGWSTQTLAVASLFAAVLSIVVLVFLSRRRASSRGNALLLTGPSFSGKTALLSSLVYSRTLPTHTSFQTNVAVYTDDQSPSKTPLRVIDIPGHPRIRDQFKQYLPDAKAIAFVVDVSTISRNGPAAAEHLHSIMSALMSLPASQTLPSLVVLAHKSDLLKIVTASADTESLAISRVRSVLERELDKRRSAQSASVGVEGLGEEGARSETGGLECMGPAGGAFRFSEWEGGDVSFLSTHVSGLEEKSDEKSTISDGLRNLKDWLQTLP